jgi:hypothetical protein
MAVKKPTSKTPAKSRTGSSKSKLNSLPKVNKWLALLFVAVIAGVGAYIIYRANAATNNCQPVDAVQICDVNMALGNETTVLSTNEWAESLGKAGFWYFGAVFRAPTSAYAGSVPITIVFNESTTFRDYMTVPQKSLKESAFPGKLKNEGVAFYAWENPGQPDTVPVYRITQGGSTSKTFYSTDLGTVNRLLAEEKNVEGGWRRDELAGSSFIAFYAYPPNYAVANQPNPKDCTILANYVSDRCAGSREALDTAVAAGNVPVGNGCPATLEIYRKAPFASQFDQACQDKWNNYMNDCSIQENFLSDRCKKERQAFVDAQAEQARQREAAAAAQRRRSGTGGTRGTGGTSGTGDTETPGEVTPDTAVAPTTVAPTTGGRGLRISGWTLLTNNPVGRFAVGAINTGAVIGREVASAAGATGRFVGRAAGTASRAVGTANRARQSAESTVRSAASGAAGAVARGAGGALRFGARNLFPGL